MSPSSFIEAGSSTERMTVASMSTATPRPSPNCFIPMSDASAKLPKTPTMIAAALVICPAVILIPIDTDSSLLSPWS